MGRPSRRAPWGTLPKKPSSRNDRVQRPSCVLRILVPPGVVIRLINCPTAGALWVNGFHEQPIYDSRAIFAVAPIATQSLHCGVDAAGQTCRLGRDSLAPIAAGTVLGGA